MHKQKQSIVSATDMRIMAANIIKKCYRDKEHFIVERDGFAVVAIIPIDQYQDLMKKPPK